jgi:hypothetical protein
LWKLKSRKTVSAILSRFRDIHSSVYCEKKMYGHENLTIFAVISAVFLVLLLHTLRQSLNSALSKVPGPDFARFSRLWEFFRACRGDLHWTTVDLHEKHGLWLEWLMDGHDLIDA